jgi:hypothetical protein
MDDAQAAFLFLSLFFEITFQMELLQGTASGRGLQ